MFVLSGVPAEEVGASAAQELLSYLASGACVDQHLQDQVGKKWLPHKHFYTILIIHTELLL